MFSDLRDTPTYTVKTAIYQGPLDLLLQLIENAELDITRLALAEVTDQYLEYLRNFPQNAASEVSSFLVVAARLIQIKSESLLPRPPSIEAGEEDPGASLVQQLIIYRRFKEISFFLSQRDRLGLHTYPRFSPSQNLESNFKLDGLTMVSLRETAQKILSQIVNQPELGSLISPPRITIRDKIVWITNFFRLHQRGTFQDLLVGSSLRLEIVVTFLAMLELIKRQMIHARQNMVFGEIEIEPSDSWQGNILFDLEFGE